MITFLSVFLGLVTGVTPVELAVSGTVSEIEVRLDGEPIGVLRGEPWRLAVDFGPELTTQELVAIARGPDGAELDRAAQWVNVPRPHAETRILLEDWRAGIPRSARLIWRAVEEVEPSAVSLTLDGEELAEGLAERYDLPALDPGSLHFLSARLEFADQLPSSAEAVFGGAYGSATETRLTARLYRAALEQLRDDLKTQQIVWLEGSHLLRQIALTGDPSGLRLAE